MKEKDKGKKFFRDLPPDFDEMTKGQKAQWILDYYWLWIFGIGFAIFMVCYIIYHAFFIPKEYWFYGMMVNVGTESEGADRLRKDFTEHQGYDTREKKVEINTSSYFDPTVKGGTNNSYYEMFVAVIEAGDLDVVVTGKEAMKAIGSSGRLLDLRDEKCGDLAEKYGDRLVWCEPYNTEDNDSLVPVGIDLSDSRLVTEYHIYEGDCVMGIGEYTNRPDQAEAFLEFALEGVPEDSLTEAATEAESE